MKNVKIIYLTILLILVVLLSTGLVQAQESMPTQALTEELLAEFTAYVEGVVERWPVPGMAVAVVQDGEIVYAEGFGVRELGKDDPVTPDTLFGIGSMTKSINAMKVATLVDEGLLDWDTPAVEIWPDFQLADPDVSSIVSLRDLLSMRTGMSPDDTLWEGEGKRLSAEELMVVLAEVPVVAQPGEQHSYDNMGVAIGGYLGALAAGGEYGDLFNAYAGLMKQRLFDPIGMTSTTLNFELMEAYSEAARGHLWDEAGRPVPASGFFDPHPGEGIIPAGGIASTVKDMARFLITQLNRGVSPDGKRVVSAENLIETWTPQINIAPDDLWDRAMTFPSSLFLPVDAQVDYGMGWFIGTYNGVQVVVVPGEQQGWSAEMALVPEADAGIVVLINAEGLPCGWPRILALQYRFIELLYGLDNQIDGFLDTVMDTVKKQFGLECSAVTE